MPAEALPALRRDLELQPMEHEGKPVFLLRDPENLTEGSVGLSPGGMAVAALLDGRRTAEEIRSLILKETGSALQLSEITGLVHQLEQAGLLETPEVLERRRKTYDEFKASPVRRSVLKGTAYPEAPLELAATLGGFFNAPKGPRKPVADKTSLAAAPIGLVSPHIDLERGGPSYAWAYQALADSPPPDVIVALGVAHASPNSPWVMTRKAYETPYGPMAVDAELYEDIRGCLWYDPTDDEWAHRKEHSLEFQALWLRYLWKEKTPPWVPILCSSFDRFSPDAPPSSVPSMEKALGRIGEVLGQRGKSRRIMILAGVDLAHVGPHFGDELELGAELEKKVEAEDQVSLSHALKLDADAFYLSVVSDGHWRKVCGLSALYTSLRWMKALGAAGPGRLLSYGQGPDPRGGLVSFASAIFP
jgi:AmmeMemoRadiSam system protein B